jgi:hypothetical protein
MKRVIPRRLVLAFVPADHFAVWAEIVIEPFDRKASSVGLIAEGLS